jgi:signal transduction histidine kinase
MNTDTSISPELSFLAGGGSLAGIIAAFDWASTPLGAIESWPISIRTTVGLILRSPVPIVTLWGEQGTMIYNDAYSHFAAGRHGRLLGSAVRDGWPEVSEFNDNVMKVCLSGGTLSYRDQELTLWRSGDPEQVWMDLDYSPVIGESGLPLGVVAIVVETTAKVRAEQNLKEEARQRQAEQQRQRRLFEQAPGFIIIMRGPEHIVEFVNEAHHQMFNSHDWTGRPIREAFPSLEGQGYFRALDDVYRSGRTFTAQGAPVRFRKAPDAPEVMHHLTFIYAPLYDDDQVSGIFCEGFDVTEAVLGEQRFRDQLERRVAERTAALQQSEKSIRTILETSHLNQGLLSTYGTVVYINATALESIKASLGDVLGRPFWETPWFTGTPGIPEVVRAAVARVATGETAHVSMALDIPTGHRIYDFSMRPVLNPAGEVVALVPEAIETTARVHAERALQQALKVEAIGNLTGGIAHDFNNLLMAILSSLELLRKRLGGDPALLRLIGTALEGARRGRSLTARMLAFARKQELKSERIHLDRLVGGMSELLERSLGPTVVVDIRLDPDLPEVETDPNQLEAALLNLVLNARDAMHGEGTIVIEAREKRVAEQRGGLKPGTYVCLSVSDTGEGMDEETLRRATEPFFTTKGIGKGTGLGLSMVHGVVEQSGGSLVLNSAPGQGTQAEIWLPALTAQVRAAATPPDASARTPPDPSARTGSEKCPAAEQASRLNILAVDDDLLVLRNMAEMMEDLGHAVVSASSAREALEQLGRVRCDLMITDHAMPLMTGTQLILEARARFPELRVILATGYAELPRGSQPGVVRLSKPFSQAELAEAISEVRGGSR